MSHIQVITGGPGSGKTLFARSFMEIHQRCEYLDGKDLESYKMIPGNAGQYKTCFLPVIDAPFFF